MLSIQHSFTSSESLDRATLEITGITREKEIGRRKFVPITGLNAYTASPCLTSRKDESYSKVLYESHGQTNFRRFI